MLLLFLAIPFIAGAEGFLRGEYKNLRLAGIEPTRSAWKANILPLNYNRGYLVIVTF